MQNFQMCRLLQLWKWHDDWILRPDWWLVYCEANSNTFWLNVFLNYGHTSTRHGTEPFRSRANSLPGANRPIGPWPIHSLELSLPGPFTPWPSRSLELSLSGLFAPWNESSMELSLSGIFVPWNFRSLNVYLTVCVYRPKRLN